MISRSAGGNSSINSLSSGDKKSRGSSLVRMVVGVVLMETDTGLVTTEKSELLICNYFYTILPRPGVDWWTVMEGVIPGSSRQSSLQ